MKSRFAKSSLVALSLCNFIVTTSGQPFRNLGFESADVPAVAPGPDAVFVSITDAFPGWTAYLGANQITQVLDNNITLGSANLSILGPNAQFLSPDIIEGRYTAILQAGGGPGDILVDAAIAQVGLVPANALLLEFKSWGSLPPSVSFDGHHIALSVIGTGPNYQIFAGDVSGFAGQVGELRFTSETSPIDRSHTLGLDSITFSSIPEPSVLGLMGFGALVAAVCIRRKLPAHSRRK